MRVKCLPTVSRRSSHFPSLLDLSTTQGEAALVRNAVVLPAKSLLEVCAHLMDRGALAHQPATAFAASHDDHYPDLSDVKGQPQAKRALEIAAAGQHSLLILCLFIPTDRPLPDVGCRPRAGIPAPKNSRCERPVSKCSGRKSTSQSKRRISEAVVQRSATLTSMKS